jgi:PAS domain S-box-containing protein
LKFTQFALDNFGESSIWVAKDGRITYANHAACRSLGYSKEEILSMHIWDIDPNYPREMIWELWSVRKRDRYTKFESVHIARDGRAFPVEVTSSYIQYGEEEYLITFDRDITECKRAEEALRDSEEKYRALFESSFDAVIIALPDGRIESANAEACRIFGKTEEEIIREGRDGIADKTDPRWQAFVEERDRTGMSRGELIYRRKDGTIFPGEASSAFFTDSKGRTKVAIIIRDISERKRAEAELERVNRALRAISKCKEAVIHAKGELALLNDVCRIIVDLGGYRMAWVGYAENDTNKTVRPMAYHGFEDGYMATVNVTWNDTVRGRGPTGTAVRTGKPCVIRYVMTDPNFLPWRDDAQKRGYNSVLGLPLVQEGHSLGALTIYSEKPNAFDEKEIGLLRDLADNLAYGVVSLRNQVKRIESEAALKAAKAQAELYLDLMGHDINNMHQVALGYLELARDLPPGEDQVRFLDKPVEVLQRSTQLIQNVRKLQKLKDGVFRTQEVDVCDVLMDVQREFGAVPHKAITLNMNECERCLIQANELLHDVFANLVSNAIKHTGDRADIVIDLDIIMDRGARYCRVMAEDDGPGIPDDFKERIFNRMLRGTTKAKGMGLGLYLVKSLVDSYGGRIWVEDRIQGDHTKGARFVVILPCAGK